MDEDGQFALILGDAGFGKSFLVRRLAYEMLGNERAGITPIVVYLRDRDKRQTIEGVGVCRPPAEQSRLPSRTDSATVWRLAPWRCWSMVTTSSRFESVTLNASAQLRTFIEALRGRAKVVLTTRPSHFRSTDEVTSKLFDNLRTVHQGRVYQLEPFDEGQQRAFLTRWFELRGEPDPAALAAAWMQALSDVDNLPELATTPRMLSFIVEDLSLDSLQRAAGRGGQLLPQTCTRSWWTDG